MPITLEGDQCLVFFLGGIVTAKQWALALFLGFSLINNANPTSTTDASRHPPYSFAQSRLLQVHGNCFCSYADYFGKNCFAYLSSNGSNNGYSPYGTISHSSRPLRPRWVSGLNGAVPDS